MIIFIFEKKCISIRQKNNRQPKFYCHSLSHKQVTHSEQFFARYTKLLFISFQIMYPLHKKLKFSNSFFMCVVLLGILS